MEFKCTGSTHGMTGKGGFVNHVNYLGTTFNGTPSHSNPRRDEYYRAKNKYAKTGDHAYLIIMSQDSIYLHRDIRTFNNFRGRSKQDFIAYERKLMRGTGRRMKSVNFIVSPSPSGDKLDPNNPHDIDILEQYMEMIVHNGFNGYFIKTNEVTKSGYRKMKFIRTNGDRFAYYGVIQPDSHDSSNLHGHLTLFNYDFTNGNGMNKNYYGRNHLKQTVKRTTAEWNQLHPDHIMTGVNKKLTGQRTPTPIIEPIIQSIQAALNDPKITSRPKLIQALKDDGIEAKHLRKTKHRKYASWKFRLIDMKHKHSWVSSTRLSSYQGASAFTAKGIDGKLHANLVNMMQTRRTKMIARQQTLKHKAPVIIQDSGMAKLFGGKSSSTSSSASRASQSSTSIPASSNEPGQSMQMSLDSSSESPSDTNGSTSVDLMSSRNASYSSAMSLADTKDSLEQSIIASKSAKALTEAENMPINPAWSSLANRFNTMITTRNTAIQNERQRVTGIMPKFSNNRARRCAWWQYRHAIPAYCIGYKHGIPVFDIHGKKNKGLLHTLISPIVDGFRKGKAWTLAKWNAGVDTLTRYIWKHKIEINNTFWIDRRGDVDINHNDPEDHSESYPLDVVDMAKDARHFGHVHTAKVFRKHWSEIKSMFKSKFIEPIMSRFNTASASASSASSAESSAVSKRSSLIEYAKAKASSAESSEFAHYLGITNDILSARNSMSEASYRATPQGQLSVSASSSASASKSARASAIKSRANIKLFKSKAVKLQSSAQNSQYMRQIEREINQSRQSRVAKRMAKNKEHAKSQSDSPDWW